MRHGMRSLWDFDAEGNGTDEGSPPQIGYGGTQAVPVALDGLGPQIQARLAAGHPPGKIAMYLEQVQPGLGRALLGQFNQAAQSIERVSAPFLAHENYGGSPARYSSPSFADARIPTHQSFLASGGRGVAQAMNGVAAALGLKRTRPTNSVTVPLDDKIYFPDGSFYIDEPDGSITIPLDESERVHSTEQPKKVSSAEPRASGPPSRAVRAIADGRVGAVGWQNPKQHAGDDGGMGWRIYVEQPDGNRIGYGHMDPSSTLKPGTPVKRGDIIDRYADPTNGHSTAPHVHVQKFDKYGRIVDPGNDSPLARSGRIKSKYGAKERGLRKKGHQGVDWVEDPR